MRSAPSSKSRPETASDDQRQTAEHDFSPTRSLRDTAAAVLTPWQKTRYGVYLVIAALFILWDYKIAFTVFNSAVCAFYTAVVVYRFTHVALSLTQSPEIRIEQEELDALSGTLSWFSNVFRWEKTV